MFTRKSVTKGQARLVAALVLVLLAAGTVALGAQEGPPPPPEGLTWSGSLNTGVRFSTYLVDNLLAMPKGEDPNFDHYLDGPVNFLMLNGRYEKGNYGAQFGLGFTPSYSPAAPEPDQIFLNNAFGWVYALDRKLYIRAGKIEEFNWTINIWSPNYRRLSWAAGYTIFDGLTVNVYGDIPNPSDPTAEITPEAYARNLDLGIYYTSSPFDFQLVVDDKGKYHEGGPTNVDQLDIFFQVTLKSIPKLNLSLESKFQNLYSSNDDALIGNITGINAEYKFTDKFGAKLWTQLGNGDFTGFFGATDKAIDEDMDFTLALKPQVNYAISDSLKFFFDVWFTVPRITEFEDFNLRLFPSLQWVIAPGPFFPAASIKFAYYLDVYNDDRPLVPNSDPAGGPPVFAGGSKFRNDDEALAHVFFVAFAISF
jgi:hypothetical protein